MRKPVYTAGDAQDALANYYVGGTMLTVIACIPFWLFLESLYGPTTHVHFHLPPLLIGFLPAVAVFLYGANKCAKIMHKTLVDVADSEIARDQFPHGWMPRSGSEPGFARKQACPLYPRKRTCAAQLPMSAKGQ